MSKPNDGGPAFPTMEFDYNEYADESGKRWPYDPRQRDGMSLRDYFAAKALPAVIASYGGPAGQLSSIDTSRSAYAYADAMLKVRSEG